MDAQVPKEHVVSKVTVDKMDPLDLQDYVG